MAPLSISETPDGAHMLESASSGLVVFRWKAKGFGVSPSNLGL
jgi:hypothetical protein